MKSKLIARRKKATVLVSPETLRLAVQKGQEILPILQSKKDPRLAQLMKAPLPITIASVASPRKKVRNMMFSLLRTAYGR